MISELSWFIELLWFKNTVIYNVDATINPDCSIYQPFTKALQEELNHSIWRWTANPQVKSVATET